MQLNDLNESIAHLEKEKEAGSLKDFPWMELLGWILTRLKEIMFKNDGTKRRSVFIRKGLLLVFAYDLYNKIRELIKQRKANQPIQY